MLQRAVRDRDFDDVRWAGELLDRDCAGAESRFNVSIFVAVAIVFYTLLMQLISKAKV